MRAVARIGLIVFALAVASVNTQAQVTDQESKEGSGEITGRVMANGKPAPGFVMTLMRLDTRRDRGRMGMFQREPPVKVLTDHEGRYRLTGLQPGNYAVVPYAPAYFMKSIPASSRLRRPLTLGEGETLEGIDFAFERGGVITGRVTKADGRPVIGEKVTVSQKPPDNRTGAKVESRDADEEDDEEDEDEDEDSSIPFSTFGSAEFKTDDRGYYRIYGLAPGRYVVSVGAAEMPFESKRSYHETTYHPGVTDVAKAAAVEVTAGGEAIADIKLGAPSTTYRASGRVIDAETGKPLANAIIIAGSAGEGGGFTSSIIQPGLSNDKGEFRLDSLTQGKHSALATFGLDGQSEFYADKLDFEIKGGDVTGLIIKAHRGSIISGIAVVEGASDPAVVEGLSQIELIAYGTSDEAALFNSSRTKINPDGSFQFRGLRPGKVQIAARFFSTERKLAVTRIERGGIEQKDFIDVAPGQQVTDMRIVLTYASASIRGQVRFEGGTVEKGSSLMIAATHSNRYDRLGSSEGEVDANGQFTFEGLVPGEYELTLTLVPPNARSQSVSQKVTVTPNAETQVTIVMDLSQKERDK